MANPEGPDFAALTTVPALMLLEEKQVVEVMTAVKNAIVKGTS